MTIENKLRCYLFYELQVAYGDTFDSDENLVRRGTMVLNAEDWYYNEDKFGISEIINAQNCVITRHGFVKRIVKPILRSMDDIDKPLSDGSVPLDVIYGMMYGSKKATDFEWLDEFKGFSIYGEGAWMTVEVLEYLYLHHFDVHGLIGGKIAIDEKIFL